MTYPELKRTFQELKRTSPREDLTAYIIFTEDSFAETYPLLGRTYLISSDNNTVIPLRSSLPEKCFAALETTGETIIIHRGVKGCTPTGQRPEGVSGQEGADKLNEQIGVTRAQAAAMLAGSMFGWACPGADPANYDAQGQPVRKAKEEPQ